MEHKITKEDPVSNAYPLREERQKNTTEQYRKNYDKIFSKKKEPVETEVEDAEK